MTIAVTGVGAITALGPDARTTFQRLARGDRGVRTVSLFPTEGYRSGLVAEVPDIPLSGVDDFSRTSELALRAAREALADAKLATQDRRVGIVVGGTTAGMLQ